MALFHNKKNFLQAARTGDAAEVAYCLTFRIPLKFSADVQDERGNSALLFATRNNDVPMIRMLLVHGANPDLPDATGVTPLLAAAAEGKSRAALALLEGGAKPDAHNGDYVYPLHYASFTGDLDVVKALISRGADLNVAILKNGRTPLHWAVEKEHRGIIEALLGAGARADIADRNGRTALDLARRKNVPHLLKLMGGKGGEEPAVGEETDHWAMAGKNRVSHAVTLPAVGRRITEIFNFESRERLVITENLKTGAETLAAPEGFDTVSEEALRKALAEFRGLGGVAEEKVVLGVRGGQKAFKL